MMRMLGWLGLAVALAASPFEPAGASVVAAPAGQGGAGEARAEAIASGRTVLQEAWDLLLRRYVVPLEPAALARADLRPGDSIVQVGDRSVQDLPVYEAVELLRGPVGSSLTLTIRRAATGQVEPVTLTRAAVSLPFVESRLIGDVAYVVLRGFP